MKILTKKMLAGRAFQRFAYPADMDEEIVDLMDTINNIPGCRTVYSCQGHGYGDWYFVVYCCNVQSETALQHYFEQEQHMKVLTDNVLHVMTDCPIHEWSVSVYSKDFDKMSAAKRKQAYAEMCKYLLQYVPRQSWTCPKNLKGKRA